MSSAQSIIQTSHLANMRALKADNSRLAAENARLKDEMASLRSHFDLALAVAAELQGGGEIELWDGWNLLLGAVKAAKDRRELIEQAKAHPVPVWIVFDGHDERVAVDGKVRVSYTGGDGAQRADRFICDYLRMARYFGFSDRVSVRTNDKKLAKEAAAIKARR
jgi:hypothetical protein